MAGIEEIKANAYFCMFYVAVLYGTHITKTRSGRLRWYNEELPAIPPTAIEIHAAYHPCTITCRRSKIHLILLYKMVQYLVDIPATDYLTAAKVKTKPTHFRQFRQLSVS